MSSLVEQISKTKKTIIFQENVIAMDIPERIKNIYRNLLVHEKKFLEDAELLLKIQRTQLMLRNQNHLNGGIAQR